jgi:hypothetical protein
MKSWLYVIAQYFRAYEYKFRFYVCALRASESNFRVSVRAHHLSIDF